MLALLGRLTDGIDEAHLGIGKTRSHQLDQTAHLFDRLSCLCSNAEAWPLFEFEDVRFSEHDIEIGQIFGQPADFDMIALADDDGMVAFADQLSYCAMGHMDQ